MLSPIMNDIGESQEWPTACNGAGGTAPADDNTPAHGRPGWEDRGNDKQRKVLSLDQFHNGYPGILPQFGPTSQQSFVQPPEDIQQ